MYVCDRESIGRQLLAGKKKYKLKLEKKQYNISNFIVNMKQGSKKNLARKL